MTPCHFDPDAGPCDRPTPRPDAEELRTVHPDGLPCDTCPRFLRAVDPCPSPAGFGRWQRRLLLAAVNYWPGRPGLVVGTGGRKTTRGVARHAGRLLVEQGLLWCDRARGRGVQRQWWLSPLGAWLQPRIRTELEQARVPDLEPLRPGWVEAVARPVGE